MADNELENLRAALEAANRRASSEATARQRIEGQLRTETGTRFAAQETAVETAIAQAESTASLAKQRWIAQQQAGNFAEAAEAMADMSKAESHLTQLRSEKSWIANQKQQVAQPASADPMAQFSLEEREWIDRNPRYLQDPTFQRRVNAAAMHAKDVMGIPERSAKWFEQIERTVYPERFADGGQTGNEDSGQQASDFGAGGQQFETDDIDVGPTVAMEQQHNMTVPSVSITPDAPAMRLDQKPQEPQKRAVGRGGGGIAAVAAPPTRRIAQASQRAAGVNGRIEPTLEEVSTAHALYDAIEPMAQDRSDETVVRWYHALYNSPTHRSTKRRNWVFAERGQAA